MVRVKLVEPGKFSLEEVAEPSISAGEVLVRVKSNGICAGDIAPYLGKKLDSFPLPSVIGHEFGGLVEEVKGKDGGLNVGDKVAVFPALPCGRCYYCTHNMSLACTNMKFYGVGGTDGGFAELFKTPVRNCVVLSKDFDTRKIGIIEPTTVAVRAIGDIKESTVAIYGVGTIGMLMIQIAKCNNNRVIVFDVDKRHLDIARRLGADLSIDSNDQDSDLKIKSFLGSEEVLDVIILTACNQGILNWAIDNVRKVGTIRNITVMESGGLSVDFRKIWTKQITISGLDCYTIEHFRQAAGLVQNGVIRTDDIVTRYFPLREVGAAFRYRVNENALKVILTD